MDGDVQQLLVELRKIVRSLDLHSRWLNKAFALTSPQLVSLNQVKEFEGLTIGDLARRTSLSCATATGIVDRLEQRGLVRRHRNGKDRRQVQLTLTETGRLTCERRPPLLQEAFLHALERLDAADKDRMLRSLRHLAEMMSGIVEERIPKTFVEQGEPEARSLEPLLSPEASPAGFIESCRMLISNPSESTRDETPSVEGAREPLTIHEIFDQAALAKIVSPDVLVDFLHTNLMPYEDAPEDIRAGIEYALSNKPGQGGFVLLAALAGEPVGALVMLNTGMRGYVPPNLLLFVAVAVSRRGQGIGAQLVRRAQAMTRGGIKLHCEYDNPARRLYERLGFTSKYAEMRWNNEPGHD